MRDTVERLRDIQDSISRIFKYTQAGRQAFNKDELIQTWVVHHLEIIGEAARAIPQDFRDQHQEIAWKPISGMRNILVHMYFDVDLKTVWQVVEQDLPQLKIAVDAIL